MNMYVDIFPDTWLPMEKTNNNTISEGGEDNGRGVEKGVERGRRVFSWEKGAGSRRTFPLFFSFVYLYYLRIGRHSERHKRTLN